MYNKKSKLSLYYSPISLCVSSSNWWDVGVGQMQQLRVCRKRLDSKLGLVIVAHQLNGIFKTTSLMSQLFFGSFVQYAFTHRLKHHQKVKVVDLVAPFVYVLQQNCTLGTFNYSFESAKVEHKINDFVNGRFVFSFTIPQLQFYTRQ